MQTMKSSPQQLPLTPVRDKILEQIKADETRNLKTKAIIITEKEYHDLNNELFPCPISQFTDNWHKAFHLHGHTTMGQLNGVFILIPEAAQAEDQTPAPTADTVRRYMAYKRPAWEIRSIEEFDIAWNVYYRLNGSNHMLHISKATLKDWERRQNREAA